MTEAEHQINLVQWFRYQYPKLTIFHIPNGEKRDKGSAIKLKKMGVLAGIPDLYVLELHLFIEMKGEKGTLSSSQEAMKLKIEHNGDKYIIAYGFDDGCHKIKRSISLYS